MPNFWQQLMPQFPVPPNRPVGPAVSGPGGGPSYNPLGNALGFQAQQFGPHTPGISVATGAQEEDYAQQQALAAQLLAQAQGGNTAAQTQLAQNTAATQRATKALAQQPGQDRMTAGYNQANEAATAGQVGAGQEAILKAQQEQQAEAGLAGLSQGMGSQSLAQALAQQQAAFAGTETNAALLQQGHQTQNNTLSAAGSSLALLSEGGDVPGKAEFGGDDPRNDTVRAKLAPHEIVIPRSIALHPDAPKLAAAFVQHVKQGGDPREFERHMDAGGEMHFAGGGSSWSANPSGFVTDPLAPWTPIGQSVYTTGTGGALDLGQFSQDQALQQQAAGLLQQSTTGGPTAAPQEFQNSTDQALAAALASSAHRGPGYQAAPGAANAGAVGALQQAAGASATTRARETATAQKLLADQLAAKRSQAEQAAVDVQQAGLGVSQLNAGINLQNQAAIRGMLTSAGQAAALGSTMNAGTTDMNVAPDQGTSPSQLGGGSPDEEDDNSTGFGVAMGGEIPEEAPDFAKAYKERKTRRKGGSGFMRMVSMQSEHAKRLARIEKMLEAHK